MPTGLTPADEPAHPISLGFRWLFGKSGHLDSYVLPQSKGHHGGERLERIPFVVNDQPFTCWDWELTKKSNQFLRDLDSSYFMYIAETHFPNLEGENAHYAAVTIRLAYSQALETLFALLGALVQAPRCPLAWVLSYKNADLYSVVEKVHRRKPILTRLTEPPTWASLSRYVHSNLGYPLEKLAWIQDGFAFCWSRFASEILEGHFLAEYNALKHGFRAKLGGFSMAIGVEEVPGQPARVEAMKPIGGSQFGSSLYLKEGLGDKLNFRPRHQACNWEPQSMVAGLAVLAMSINNTASFLRILGGEPPEQCKFETPLEKTAFEQPWQRTVGVTTKSFDTSLSGADISALSKKDILDTY